MPRLFLHTAQLELTASSPGDVELHFGAQVAPKGFAWVVPVTRPREQCARLGVMCDGDATLYFQRLAARVGTRWGFATASVGRPRQKILPLAPISRTYGDRLLAIGADTAHRLPDDLRAADHGDLLYDENGLPR